MSQANVRSVDAIKHFKVALINFAEDARTSLGAMEMEIRQVRNWLERDQLNYWRSQIKRSQEAIAEARAELHRRQITQMNSDAVSDSEQKEALRTAQRKLHEAEEMVERIKKWIPVLEHALAEYHSQAQPLGDKLSGGLVGSLALLERMVHVLDEYAALQAPSAPVLPPTPGSASEPPRKVAESGGAAPDSPGQEAAADGGSEVGEVGSAAEPVPVAAVAAPADERSEAVEADDRTGGTTLGGQP